MKKFILIVCCLLSMTGTVSAITYDFDAIPLEPGQTWKYYSTIEFNAFFTGVSFTNTGGDLFRVQEKDADLEPDFAGNVILTYPMKYHGTTIATFDTPVAFVSVTIGDRGIDPDKLNLKAYNSSGTLIGQDSYSNPWYSYAGHTLSVSRTSADIARVEFYGWAAGYNSVYWDNFTFSETAPGSEACPTLWDPVCGEDGETYSNACYAEQAGTSVAYNGVCNDNIPDPDPDPDPSAVPEPATLLLFGTGLFAMLALVRRILKKQ